MHAFKINPDRRGRRVYPILRYKRREYAEENQHRWKQCATFHNPVPAPSVSSECSLPHATLLFTLYRHRSE